VILHLYQFGSYVVGAAVSVSAKHKLAFVGCPGYVIAINVRHLYICVQ
jgi:hypothetical protein